MPGNRGAKGYPGGQMVVQELFQLDSVYETKELIVDPDKYIIKFKFKDNIEHDLTQHLKIIELDKKSFLVTKVIRSYVRLGSKAVHQIALSDFKINEEVKKSISDYQNEIENFTLTQPIKPQPSNLLSKEVPNLKLPTIEDENVTVSLNTGKVTLLDFWEVWCGPCIKSLPEIERMQQSYADKLQVIGVITQSKDKVLAMLERKGISIQVLQGNKQTLKQFGVNSWPRYFIIDEKGVIRKEYYNGYSEQIEKDILELIN